MHTVFERCLQASGSNCVGAGVWDYRLSRMWCAAVAPLGPYPALGGGGSVVIRLSVFVWSLFAPPFVSLILVPLAHTVGFHVSWMPRAHVIVYARCTSP